MSQGNFLGADWHADLLEQLLAAVLNEVGQIGQRLPGRQAFAEAGQPAGETVKDAESLGAERLEAGVPAAALRLLPECLALAAQSQIVLRPQENQVIDHRRVGLKRGQLHLQVLRLSGPAPEEEADADLPRLTILARPVSDSDDAVGGMVAEGE